MWVKKIMKQAAKLYWSQHKVFFIATLVLFPDDLNGHEVNQWFYRPYFAGDDPTFIEIELEDYRKAGYLKYEKPGSLYKITDIDTQKAAKDLMQYLEQWQRNELHALSAAKPPDTMRQKELLLAAIVSDYTDHKDVQRITLEGVYGKPDNNAYKPPFWELVLAYQLIDKKIKITSMDYGKREDGLYDDDRQPAVDIKIVDKELLGLVEQRVAQKAEPASPTTPAGIVAATTENTHTTREGRVIKDGRLICIAINDDKTYVIKRLDKGGTYDKFMNYVLAEDNSDIDISIKDINAQKGLASAKNLSLLARYSGFVKPFKRAFFVTSGREKIHFRQTALLNGAQIEAIKKLAEKV